MAVNGVLRIWKAEIAVYFKVLFQYKPGGSEPQQTLIKHLIKIQAVVFRVVMWWITTFQRTMLPPSSQYPTTSLHGVRTQKP
jgi:hypothetical protein